MNSQKFLASIELWPTLKKLAKTYKSRSMLAVPYIGTGGSKLLPLKRNDILICALSEANARNGSVNPSEIKTLQRRGVKVYQEADLHAKVYLFGRTAVIGSANLSKSSLSQLDEVGLLTQDSNIIKCVETWFAERISEPLTPKWLAHCGKIYRPPRNEWSSKTKRRRQGNRRPRSSLWLMAAGEVVFPEHEDKARELGYRTAKKYLRSPNTYGVEEIRWPGKARLLEQAQRGDLIIQIWDTGKGDRKVCPHARLLGKKKTKTKTGGSVTYLYLETPKKYRTIAWKQFRKTSKELGLALSPNLMAKEISNRLMARNLAAIVSPERLMTKDRNLQ